MVFEYFPGDIAAALSKIAGVSDNETVENVTGALYELKAICENRYNPEFYRDLYRVLEKVTQVTI